MNSIKNRNAIYVAIEGKDTRSYFNGWVKSLEIFEKFDRSNSHRRRRAA